MIKMEPDIDAIMRMNMVELKGVARDLLIQNYRSARKDKLQQNIINTIRVNQARRIQLQEEEEKKQAEEAQHREGRSTQIRQQIGAEDLISTLEYPFEFIRTGEYDRQTAELPGQPQEDVGDFPDNIAHYYWISPGENDEAPWLLLCRLTNGVYVFYKGECDYTGFDCQGCMRIYASKDPAVLILYGMCTEDYEKYIQDTHVFI